VSPSARRSGGSTRFRHSVAIVTESRDELVVTAMQALGTALEREIGSRAFGPTLSFSLGVHLD
jgi:hypothetical protein